MKHCYEIVKIQPHAGSSIEDVAREAVALASERQCIVKFKFNDIKLEVDPWSTHDSVTRDYNSQLHPYPY